MLTRQSETNFKCLKETFRSSKHSSIKNVTEKDNTCVIVLVIFYDHRTTNPMKVFRVLSCVVYSEIDNYACIDYFGCQY